MKELDEPFYGHEVFAANFDQDPRLTTLRDRHDKEHPMLSIGIAIEEVAKSFLDDGTDVNFRKLIRECMAARFAAIIVIPVLALVDRLKSPKPQAWHQDTAEQLLTDADILESTALHDTRRLLRKSVLARTTSEQVKRLADRLRLTDISQDSKLRELSDFDVVHLTSSELNEIAKAKTYGTDTALDPRTEPLFRTGRGSNVPISEPESDWPYPDDVAAIKACDDLRYGKLKESDFTNISDPKLVDLLKAFAHAIDRPEATESKWFGGMVAKASSIVALAKRILCRDITDDERPFQSERWHQLLEGSLPWWAKWTKLAMTRLGAAVPDSHQAKDAGDSSSWSPDDEFYNSVEFLNRVLLIPRSPPFFDLQEELGSTIENNWQSWPSYSRASVLLEAHPWFFAQITSLRHLLTHIVNNEGNSHVMKLAIRYIDSVESEVVPKEFDMLFERTDAALFHSSFFIVGERLGCQMIPTPSSSNVDHLDVNRQTLDDWLSRTWQSDDLYRAFASGVLDGARDALVSHANDKAAIYEFWLKVLTAVIDKWRFANTDDDTKDFPIIAIWGVLENEPSGESRSILFGGFTKQFIHLMRHGSLGVFSNVHHIIGDMIDGRSLHSESAQQPMAISNQSDAIFLRLCQASVERVRDWSRKGKTTDDLGWGTALNGAESAKLIRTCLAACFDPKSFASSAISLCDVLASAGHTALAAELRLELRSAN